MKFFQWQGCGLVQALEPNAVGSQALNRRRESSGDVVRRWNALRFGGFESVLEPHLFRLANIQSPQHRLSAEGIDLFHSISHQDFRFYIGSFHSRSQGKTLSD